MKRRTAHAAGRIAAGALGLALVPTPALAAEGASAADVFWHALNLALLVGVIVYFARAPIQSYLAERRQTIEHGIEGAAGDLQNAENRLAEWQHRMDSLEGELEEIRGQVRAQAEAERAKLLEEAQATAERIRADATAAVEQEIRQARAGLRSEAADLAVKLAGDLLRDRMTDDDRGRLVEQFVERVERGPAAGAES